MNELNSFEDLHWQPGFVSVSLGILLITKGRMAVQHLEVQHLGTLPLPIMIFGGPYGNFAALTALSAQAELLKIPPQQIICTGDCVAYCAHPEEVVDYIRRWGIFCIKGNVEEQITDNEDNCGCNFNAGSLCDRLSQAWYPYARDQLGKASKQWLASLPSFITFLIEPTGDSSTAAEQLSVEVVHGSRQQTAEFVFASNVWDVPQRRDGAGFSITIAGHCGIPFLAQHKQRFWLNAGVIGMPANDGTARGWYLLLREHGKDGLLAELHPLAYDHRSESQAILAAGLPTEYAESLASGLWCSCDILPEAERQRTGIPLTSQQLRLRR